jgi:2-phospho-L-lactate guanylyltransferase
VSPPPSLTWSVVIPIKPLPQAKSRLAELAGPRRGELALAMAADTVTAVAACPAVAGVIVVTDDATAGVQLRGLGAVVIPDTPASGLNPALLFGAAYSARHWPGRGVAALAADLPALRPAELGAALAAAGAWPQAFVADAAGSGTTLYTAGTAAAFSPRFGPGSRDRHAALGAVQLGLPGIGGLRQDVDTGADLRVAAGLGLGRRTAVVAAGLLGAHLRSGAGPLED